MALKIIPLASTHLDKYFFYNERNRARRLSSLVRFWIVMV